MPTTVMMAPIIEGHPVRCPGTAGRKSHIFYMASKPKPDTVYRCAKCYPLMQLDRIARDISAYLDREDKTEDSPRKSEQITGKTIEQLLDEIT